MFKWIRFSLLAALAVAAVYAGGRPWGVVPPIAAFVNPFAGFWLNGSSDDGVLADRELPGLQEPVTVLWDERRIPHIFAGNTHDLFYAQGYVTARDRLWQLDFSMRAAAGRLSEIVGAAALEYDRFQRRIGMVAGAERAVEQYENDPEIFAVIDAYCDGVNAWIDQLDPKHYPVEYKALGFAPERLTVYRVSLMNKYFQYDQSWNTRDSRVSRAVETLGRGSADKMYPDFPPYNRPVIPAGTQWLFEPLDAIQPRNTETPAAETGDAAPPETPGNGSNNWTVGGERTKSGYPIVCYDPHMRLTLPPIWYETHLVSPGINVFGVTSPGVPGIIFGFNGFCAWGGTNAHADVVDWYNIRFRDASMKEYRYDDGWRPTTMRVEEIHVRGARTVLDTTWYTHHGPVVYRDHETPFNSGVPKGHAMSWAAWDTGREMRAIYEAMTADSFDDFSRAIAIFECPHLNINYGDVDGTIAIWHSGKYPLRWWGQGKTLLDGADPGHDWQGYIPPSHVPFVKNPTQGFVASANQLPTDESYPYYLGWTGSDPYRAARINERLTEMTDVTPDDVMALQTDVYDELAREVLPTMLGHVRRDSLDAGQMRAYEEVSRWDYRQTAREVGAQIFNFWWRQFYHEVWDDEVKRGGGWLEWPEWDVTQWMLLEDPGSPFFDNRNTESKETMAGLIHASFCKAIDDLENDCGPFGPAWEPGAARGTDIRHLGGVPGFGRTDLVTGGTGTTVNATNYSFGPSWRFVCALGPEPQVWTVLAGGQSGNPGSVHYDDEIEDWVGGTYRRVPLPRSPEDTRPGVVGRTMLGVAR